MNDLIQLAWLYVRMLWRYRWVALVAGSLVCAGGWIYVLVLPNQYQVTAKVYLDTRSLLDPLLRGIAVGNQVRDENLRMIRSTLLVRPNLEKVARNTDMDLQAKTPEAFERMLIGLAEKIQIVATRESENIFVIVYQNRDPKLAARVVEALLNIFVESVLGEGRKDASSSREFLEKQIAEYELRLDEAEQRLKDFKRQNVGMMPSDGKNYYSRLEEMRGVVANAELELREAHERVQSIEDQMADAEIAGDEFKLEPAFGIQAPTPYDERINALEVSLDEMLLQYTDQWPDVISSRRLLSDLQEQRKAYLAEYAEQRAGIETLPGAGGEGNLLSQQLALAYSDAQANLAALEARVAEYRRRADELAKLVDTVPKVEAELTKLNRDYSIVKSNYEDLVQRLESLKITDEAGQSAGKVQFNVIDPPRVPLVPVSPDRLLLSITVLVVGVGGGIAIAILLAMVRPAIYSKVGFREITELPVLGVVSRLWTPKERTRRRLELATFGAGCMVLVVAFVGVITMYQLGIEIDAVAKIESLIRQFQ